MTDAESLALPDEAVVVGADATRRLGARARQNRGLSAARAKKKARHPAGDWRRQRLVDENPTTALRMFQREDCAVRQQTD